MNRLLLNGFMPIISRPLKKSCGNAKRQLQKALIKLTQNRVSPVVTVDEAHLRRSRVHLEALSKEETATTSFGGQKAGGDLHVAHGERQS